MNHKLLTKSNNLVFSKVFDLKKKGLRGFVVSNRQQNVFCKRHPEILGKLRHMIMYPDDSYTYIRYGVARDHVLINILKESVRRLFSNSIGVYDVTYAREIEPFEVQVENKVISWVDAGTYPYMLPFEPYREYGKKYQLIRNVVFPFEGIPAYFFSKECYKQLFNYHLVRSDVYDYIDRKGFSQWVMDGYNNHWTGPGWIKDLTCEGIEPNPGPYRVMIEYKSTFERLISKYYGIKTFQVCLNDIDPAVHSTPMIDYDNVPQEYEHYFIVSYICNVRVRNNVDSEVAIGILDIESDLSSREISTDILGHIWDAPYSFSLDPYGEHVHSYRFSPEYYVDSHDLSYCGKRYMNPACQRFINIMFFSYVSYLDVSVEFSIRMDVNWFKLSGHSYHRRFPQHYEEKVIEQNDRTWIYSPTTIRRKYSSLPMAYIGDGKRQGNQELYELDKYEDDNELYRDYQQDILCNQ